MKLPNLTKTMCRLTGVLVLLVLSSCAAIPGLSIIADLSDFQAIQARGLSNVPDDELRDMEERALPASTGLSYDIGLVRRSLIQLARGNLNGLRQTRDLAIRSGTNEDIVVDVRVTAAFGERMFLHHQVAMAELETIERRVVELAHRRGKPVLANRTARRALTNQLWLAMDMANLVVAGRIVTQYFEPGIGDLSISPEDRLILRFEVEDYRAALKELQADPAGAYKARIATLTAFEREVALMPNARPEYKNIFWSQQQLLRMKAGTAAIAYGRPSLAWEQLQLMKGDETPSEQKFDQAYRIADLEAAYFSSVQDFDSALKVDEVLWKRAPVLMKRATSQRLGHAAQRAGYLASLGRWPEARQTLSAEPFVSGSASGVRVDYFVGLRSLVAAVLGSSDSWIDDFNAMEPRYAALRGTDLALYYSAAKTIIYQKRSLASGSMDELIQAVEGGREMGRTLRILHASGFGGVTTLSPRVLQLAKESYLKSASAALEQGSASMDDLLDALQLLQLSEVDRDISATSARLRSIPGVSTAQLRDLQDLQQLVRASQQKVARMSLAEDVDPGRLEREAMEANRVAGELNDRLSTLQVSAPQLVQAFGGTKPLTLKDIQFRLRDDEGLAVFAPMGESTLAMVVMRDRVMQRMVSADSTKITRLVARIRKTVVFPEWERDPMPAFDTAAARELHDLLLGWATGQLWNVRSMTVIPTGALGALPFGLLVGEGHPVVPATDYRHLPWLIRSKALVHAPSIRSWYAVTSPGAAATHGGFIAWADPDYSGNSDVSASSKRSVRRGVNVKARQDGVDAETRPINLGALLPRLGETRQEAQAMARALGGSNQSDLVLGRAATRESVLARSGSGDLARRSVVLFATHGLVPAQVPGLDQPALAMAREGVSKDPSLLKLEDVLGLRLNADWVILSACNTASADRIGGDPLSGLARGFFFAGARSLLVTHWEVESESAMAITTGTIGRYARDRRLSRAQALQQASIDLIDGRGVPAEWAHPAFWAPYALVGNGRRSASNR